MNAVAQHITAAAHQAGTRTLHAGGPIAFVLNHAMQPQKVRLLGAAGAGLAAALAAHVYQRWRMRRRIRRMTKVELHAHLNGSIRPTTLRRLAAEQGLDAACLDKKRTLEVCFEVFALIHKCVDSLEVVALVALEFLEDLRAGGCAYVELRTTPRALGSRTEADYVKTVCNVLSGAPGITARLLVSVDRSRGPEAAKRTLAAVANLRRSDAAVDCVVVGVDFSGNPTSKHGFDAFERLFREVRDEWGLGCALHVGETPRSDGDAAKILKFADEKPRRVRFGHALAFSDHELRDCASLIEACPSSNAATLDLAQLADHPRLRARFSEAAGPPLAICTDDAGVFGCSLAGEYLKVHDAFGPVDLVRVVDDAAAAAFDARAIEAVRRRRAQYNM